MPRELVDKKRKMFICCQSGRQPESDNSKGRLGNPTTTHWEDSATQNSVSTVQDMEEGLGQVREEDYYVILGQSQEDPSQYLSVVSNFPIK